MTRYATTKVAVDRSKAPVRAYRSLLLAVRWMRIPSAAVLMLAATEVSVALAGHTESGNWKKFSSDLLNDYFECSSPNTATQFANQPACAPPVAPQLCALSPDGSAKLMVVATGSPGKSTQDIKLAVTAKGLTNCEGEALCIRLSFRATTDDCPEGSCTMIDTAVKAQAVNGPGVENPCCVVTNGTCKIKTTWYMAVPGFGLFPRGKNSGIEILGCGLDQDAGSPADAFRRVLVCGAVLR